MAEPNRCPWAKTELERAYHDTEWCRPLHDDRKLFEFLVLEGMQAGLSWRTVLEKRESMRAAFDGFDPVKIARYTDEKRAELLQNPAIIRNRLKISSITTNAIAFLAVQREFGSFDAYLWAFVDGRPIDGNRQSVAEMPATTPVSDALSKNLKKRGFKFVGSTIVYSFMQAAGMVNDHLASCEFHG